MKSIICLLVVLFAFIFPYTVIAGVTEVDNLERDKEPIVLKGSMLPAFCNQSITKIFVLAYHGGFEVIPFQVDQRAKINNTWVYVESEGTNLFDADDEICFLSKDMGDRVDISTWPQQAQSYLYEISAYDGTDNEKMAYAYIVLSTTFTPSATDYIDILNTNPFTVESYCYQLGFCKDAPHIMTEIKIKPEFGGNFNDIIDRVKTRLATTFFKIYVTEDAVLGELRSDADVIDGPVRVIEQILGKALKDTTFFSNVRHYPELTTNDLTLDLTPTVIFTPIWLRYSTDLDPDMKDAWVITNYGGKIQRLKVDGIQDYPTVRPLGTFMEVWSPTFGSTIQCMDMDSAQALMHENPDSIYFFWNDGGRDPSGVESGDGICWGEHGIEACRVPKDRLPLRVKEFIGLESENSFQKYGVYYFDSLQVSLNYNYKNTPYTVNLQPVLTNITLPKTGGKITFNATLKNLTGNKVNLKAWLKVLLPDGSIYPKPVMGPVSLSLAASEEKTISNLKLSIPGSAPAGDYSVMGHLGPDVNTIYHTDSFVFTKLKK